MAQGALVLVVGPSGAGKDTLIAAAQAALGGDGRFVFPRRVVTRTAVAELEDHDSLGHDDFEAARRSGRFALDWEAHGLRYGLPGSIEPALAAGKIVVANVSRRVIPDAVRKYARARVVLITAEAGIRARRLAGRGRESPHDVEARLKREGAAVPKGIAPIVIDNSGALEGGIAAIVAALRRIATE